MVQTFNHNCLYQTAIYLRLSRDDDGEGESASITTQRKILHQYGKDNGFVIQKEYVDDGYSGTNFERPDFKHMMQDIEAKRINCILVKDFSRLGRNMGRTTELIEEYFPLHGVRCISVGNGYDSLTASGDAAFTVPMHALMGELYARDISSKIRSAFRAKMENGECVASFAPYGYKKDLEHGDKNHLVIDHNVSGNVRRMFQMAYGGSGPGEIAAAFNAEHIPTPAMYRCRSGPQTGSDHYSKRREWTPQIICKMLRNETYTGTLCQGKTTKVSFKSKKTRTNPREQWIIVPDAHEPIVPRDVFETVQKRSVARRCPPVRGFHNIFSGIARCADCGRTMTTAPSHRKGATCSLCCGGYKNYGAEECSNHFIDYDQLCSVVLQELRKCLDLPEESREHIRQGLTEQLKKQDGIMTPACRELARARKREGELVTITQKLYEDYALGTVTAEMYRQLSGTFRDEMEGLKAKIAALNRNVEKQAARDGGNQRLSGLLNDVTDIRKLSRPLLLKLIGRIEVEQGSYVRGPDHRRVKEQTIRIYYRFRGETEGGNVPQIIPCTW